MKESERDELRDRLMGLGKQSVRKNYYVDLRRELDQRIEAQAALKQLNEELESTVKQRTSELLQMQKHLVESEKLASLGSLVAGISHEVNTPLGISVTLASHISQLVRTLNTAISQEDNSNEWPAIVEELNEAATILESNLKRSVDLMENFKQIAVDQNEDFPQTIDYLAYTQSIVKSLQPELKKKEIQVVVTAENACIQLGYPGIWSQVIVNLVMNSVVHGFEVHAPDGNQIHISFIKEAEVLHCHYSDNGIGIGEEVMHHLYDPFFTTKRGGGGTGLGLFIVHKLMVDQLDGSIICLPNTPRGVIFKMTLGLRL